MKLFFIYFSFSASTLVIIISLIIAGIISYLYYKNTIPQISRLSKIILGILRFLALFFALLTLYEIVLGLTVNKTKELKTIFVFDNTKSIGFNINEENSQSVQKLKDYIQKKISNPAFQLYSFNSKLSDSSLSDVNSINFTGSSTNISSALAKLKDLNEAKDIKQIVLITDGIYNEGDKPTYIANEIGIPFYTIGIGDTSFRKDIVFENIITNEFLYINNKTQVRADIKNNGFGDAKANLSFYANNQFIFRNEVQLKEGINEITFDFIPKEKGEVKLSAKIEPLKNELSEKNNIITKFINVLDNKLKILLIAPSPTNDFGFIINSLRENKDFEVSGLIEKQDGGFYPQYSNKKFLDSAQVIFFIGYPGINSSSQLINEINNLLSTKNIPLFILVSNLTDFNKLQIFDKYLPFTQGNFFGNITQVFIDVAGSTKNEIMDLGAINNEEIWNTFPPIFRVDKDFNPKPGAEVLANFRIQNTRINLPLILRQNLNKQKSIAFLGFEIWRLKLTNSFKSNENYYFDAFINNSVKWLSSPELKKQFIVRPIKKIFDYSDKMIFIAQLYDQSNNPISNAEVQIALKKAGSNPLNSVLEPLGNGIYKVEFESLDIGDYSFEAQAVYQDKNYRDNGTFSVAESELEYKDLQMRSTLLQQISNNTSGRYYNISDIDKFIDDFEKIQIEKVEVSESSEIKLWNTTSFLLIIIILLSIEWFLRKRLNLL